jgi:hypothetical protein
MSKKASEEKKLEWKAEIGKKEMAGGGFEIKGGQIKRSKGTQNIIYVGSCESGRLAVGL